MQHRIKCDSRSCALENGAQMKAPWIIRFADGTLASHYGSRESAQTVAEEKKDRYGGDYIII